MQVSNATFIGYLKTFYCLKLDRIQDIAHKKIPRASILLNCCNKLIKMDDFIKMCLQSLHFQSSITFTC